MGEPEDAEIERRSQAMVDAQKPVRYWQRGPTVASLAAKVEELEQRVASSSVGCPGSPTTAEVPRR